VKSRIAKAESINRINRINRIADSDRNSVGLRKRLGIISGDMKRNRLQRSPELAHWFGVTLTI